MILTGSEIKKEVINGRIIIEPFSDANINPNSYNFCIDNKLLVYNNTILDAKVKNATRLLEIPEGGFILQPQKLYLANTVEILGSDLYAPTYNARSSVARLGLFINLSATLCDIGFIGQITMQLYAANAIRIYPGMKIGQIMFWKPFGQIDLYKGKYQSAYGPRATEIYRDFN